MEIRAQIREFVIETLYVDDDEGIRDQDSLLERGVLDSTGVLEVVAYLEDSFGIVVEDGEIVPANLDSIEGMTQFVEGKLRSAA